jgi:hypothetical protein
MRKTSVTVLFVALAVVLMLVFSPGSSGTSTNPCGQCHSGRYVQYLDILEGSSVVPTQIGVGETKTVTVSIENNVNTATYATLSSVSITLASKNGYVTVGSPTVNIGSLPAGTKTATWQITGVSDGYDSLIITATGINPHLNIPFSDSYSPSPSITVGQPTTTPSPAPTSPPTTAPSPTANPSSPTPAPSQAPTPTPAPSPGTNPEVTPTPSPANPLSIELTSPATDEKWTPGTSHTINWRTSGGTDPLTITLEYSTASINGPWSTIATGIEDNGSFAWAAPNATGTLYIRVFVIDSGNPAQNALTISNVEIGEDRSGLLLIVTVSVVLLVIAGLVVLVYRKWRAQTREASGGHAQ